MVFDATGKFLNDSWGNQIAFMCNLTQIKPFVASIAWNRNTSSILKFASVDEFCDQK